ncbi:MAG: RagB/SusD family nutrient uptake outer membrane protein, partial [Bacteroidota bacterium]
ELYVGINDLNLIFAKIDELDDLTSEEETLRQQIKGEAYFLRALYYHDLAKVYGYEPGQEVNNFNLTVPIRTTPTEDVSDALTTNPRATNLEVYELIEADLAQAIDLLEENNNAPLRVNQATVHALMARVQLYKGAFAMAAQQAQLALDKTTATLTNTDNFEASWEMIPHPESLFEAEIRATDWSTVDGANRSICTMTNNTSASSQYILVGSPELMAILDNEPNDIRHSIWTVEEDIPDGTRKCNKWRGEQGDFRENIPIIRYAEVLLIAAEGFARSGDNENAQIAVNELRVARGLTETTLMDTALIDLIMQERRIELALEGHRWFDLKRLGMAIPKTATSNAPTLSYTDFRILADIPQSELSLNPLLVQNPGY